MGSWADIYRPKDLNKLSFLKRQAFNLKKLVQSGDLPNLLVFGPPGAGKRTRIMCLLKEAYGPCIERMHVEKVKLFPSQRKLEIMVVNSCYHMELNMSDVGIEDRILFIDLINKMLRIQPEGQKEHKVFVLTDVDELPKEAQNALKETMADHVSNCRFILCANSISRILPSIQSRCLNLRVSAPSINEIVMILKNICKKESLTLPHELALRIASKSNRNIRTAIYLCEECKQTKNSFRHDQIIPDPEWLIYIRAMSDNISQEHCQSTLANISNFLYELIMHGIPANIIFKTLVLELLKPCNDDLKNLIVEIAAFYEHILQNGNEPMIHLEAFLENFVLLYKNFTVEN